MTDPRRQDLPRATQRQQADVSKILRATFSDTDQTVGDPPVLIQTMGLPGSGKSTFVRRLAPEIDAVVLESDALRRLLFGTAVYSVAESRQLFAAVHEAASQLLRSGHNVIIDATSLNEVDRRPAYRIVEETGARLLLLNFYAPKAVIEKRLVNRAISPDPNENSSADIGVYTQMAERVELPSRAYTSIDTSNAEASDAALRDIVETCRSLAEATAGGTR